MTHMQLDTNPKNVVLLGRWLTKLLGQHEEEGMCAIQTRTPYYSGGGSDTTATQQTDTRLKLQHVATHNVVEGPRRLTFSGPHCVFFYRVTGSAKGIGPP